MNQAPLDTPFVSVILPVYNGRQTVSECLDSILAGDYPADRREIICVDNNSTDGTPEVLAEYGDRIRLFSERQQGPAAARNRALKEARGTLVAFTDADATVHRDWLRELTAAMDENVETVVGGRILAKPPANWIERFGERIHDHEKAITVFKPPYVASGNYCAHLSFLRELGFFDVSFRRGEDSDLSRRMVVAGARLVYAPSAVVYHRNERTLAGLFREGMQHGYWGVMFRRRHDADRPVAVRFKRTKQFYQQLFGSLAKAVRGIDRPDSWGFFVFNSGKAMGRLIGSVRFGFYDL